MMEKEIYDFKEHLHRYAVWTAARAVQRGFAKTETIKEAINSSHLQRFSQRNDIKTFEQFENEHTIVCSNILKSFKEKDIRGASYGRAAKIVNIYLKTAVILPTKGGSDFAKIIHPPIDRILLTNINII